jgi:hypothetical protein
MKALLGPNIRHYERFGPEIAKLLATPYRKNESLQSS